MEKQRRVGYADHKSAQPGAIDFMGTLPHSFLVPPQSGRLDAVKPFSSCELHPSASRIVGLPCQLGGPGRTTAFRMPVCEGGVKDDWNLVRQICVLQHHDLGHGDQPQWPWFRQKQP